MQTIKINVHSIIYVIINLFHYCIFVKCQSYYMVGLCLLYMWAYTVTAAQKI